MTTDQLIRKEIKRLHERGSSNERTLMSQVLRHHTEVKPIQYNAAQVLAAMFSYKVKDVTLEWARGTGKTTAEGGHVTRLVQDMPRGVSLYVGQSYKKLLTDIIPSLIHGLEMHGYYKDLHYFIGRRPPASWKWPESYKPPKSYKNFISFYNGHGFQMLSQSVVGDGRGLNGDALMTDESALLDKSKLDEWVRPALRGTNTKKFINSHFFNSEYHATSTPMTLTGRWIIEREELAHLYPDKYAFLRADSRINKQNLAPGYLEKAKETTHKLIYDAEYMNKRVTMVEDGFYPRLSEELHSYMNNDEDKYYMINQSVNSLADVDCVATEPLHLGIDWGASINAMIVGQETPDEFRLINNFYSLSVDGETQTDMGKKFIDYYSGHAHKTAFVWYDNTGNINTGFTKLTRAEIFRDQLIAAGWNVQLMTRGSVNVQHELKYTLWDMILHEDKDYLPRFRHNRENAREAWISMTNAPAKQGRNDAVKKDKSSERHNSSNRPYATDLSDAVDVVIWGLYSHLLKSHGRAIAGGGKY